MPCFSVVLNQVEMPKMQPDLLRRALTALGAEGIHHYSDVWSFTLQGVPVSLRGGQMTVPQGYEFLADKVKQAYSRQVVGYAAAKAGWQVREVKPNQFAVTRR